MAMIKSIIILASIAAYYDYEIWQVDVKTTFLNIYLKENIYMMQPNGFIIEGQECKTPTLLNVIIVVIELI